MKWLQSNYGVGSKVPVGYIPAGSTNDFANSLFMPKNMLDAASMIMKEEIYRCDVGRFNSQTFAYVAAFGLLQMCRMRQVRI